MGHIELARWADRIVVAPGTADLLARLAQGHADDLVSTLCLASTAPLTICPAMNHRMWLHPATQANIALLRQRGAQVIGPVDGPLAEGESGPGRLAEPGDIGRAGRQWQCCSGGCRAGNPRAAGPAPADQRRPDL
jgi:phosphopantothenoylcysteine decarboxylase/phosphopantothenate--cysteine ligase